MSKEIKAGQAFNEATLAQPIIRAPRAVKLASRKKVLLLTILSAVILTTSVVCGLTWMEEATSTDIANQALMPSWEHPFGTDRLGHDMLIRTVSGLTQSILIGLLAATVSACIALILGMVAALGGRRADALITWLIDLMLGVPHIVLLILISYAAGKGFWGVVIGVALTHWPMLTRVIRAEVLQVKESAYIAQAHRLGVSPLSIAWHHMVPHVFPQFLVGTLLLFPHAILHEASITFLGFGLSPESAAIGIILSESMTYLSSGMWWLAVFPGLALIGVVMLFDAMGQGVRRLMTPGHAQE